jgi:hypothetical protein
VGPPPPGATRELGVVAMLLSLMGIRPEGRTVNTHESRLFTGLRGRVILGSSLSSGAARRRLRVRHEAPEDGIADAPLKAP